MGTTNLSTQCVMVHKNIDITFRNFFNYKLIQNCTDGLSKWTTNLRYLVKCELLFIGCSGSNCSAFYLYRANSAGFYSTADHAHA